MAHREIPLPGMGEGVIEAVITRWLVKEGEQVEEEQPLVEVATDKVDSEVISPAAGKVVKILHPEGETVEVGKTLLIIKDDTPEEKKNEPLAGVGRISDEIVDISDTAEKTTEKEDKIEREERSDDHSVNQKKRFLSPLVRKIISEEGIREEELEDLVGSGINRRITKEDLLQWIAERKRPEKVTAGEKEESDQARHSSRDEGESSDEYEVIEMDRVRRLIADHMVESVKRAPHVTSFIEVDVTAMVEWRSRIKDDFFKREGEKLTFTPLFIEAVAHTLREFPMVNVSVDGTRILRKKHINIGMATALPDGNLIVQVIRDADRKNLVGLAKEVNDLADRARKGKLKPAEIQGGTFTITNFGTFRNLTGTPIINQPESAILGVGAILKKPAVVATSHSDAIAVRHLVILSLSYDHRVIDGALGGRFLQRLAEYLEGFDTSRRV